MGDNSNAKLPSVSDIRRQSVNYIDEKFRLGQTIQTLHHMMTEVTKDEITPETVNAACNCVKNLNSTIKTAIQAAKFINAG